MEQVQGEIHCRKCNYALVGLTVNRCPECGRKFDPEDARTFLSDVLDGRHYLRWCMWVLGGIAFPLVLLGLTKALEFGSGRVDSLWVLGGFVVSVGAAAILVPMTWLSAFGLVSIGWRGLARNRCIVTFRLRARIGFLIVFLIAFGPAILAIFSLAILLLSA